MNVNELNVQKSTLFPCLHNPFLKELIPEYISVVTHAVTPKEIGLQVSPQCFPFYFTFVIFIRKIKLLNLRINLTLLRKFPFLQISQRKAQWLCEYKTKSTDNHLQLYLHFHLSQEFLINHQFFHWKLIYVIFLCYILYLFCLAPLQYFFFITVLPSAYCSLQSIMGESVKIRNLNFFHCFLSHLRPGFWNGRTSAG